MYRCYLCGLVGKDLELLAKIHKVCDTVKKGTSDLPLNMSWKCVHSRVYSTIGGAYQGSDEYEQVYKRMSWACHHAKQYMFDKGTLTVEKLASNAD